jgi:hypothetical protein
MPVQFFTGLLSVLRIRDILLRIRINGSVPLTNDPDPTSDPAPTSNPAPDPAIFVIDLYDANKKLFFPLSFSSYYFLKVRYIFIIFLR